MEVGYAFHKAPQVGSADRDNRITVVMPPIQQWETNSSTVSPMSRAIWRSRGGAMSRPLCRGTVVHATIGVAVLNMRSTLAQGLETETFQQATDFRRFEDGDRTHDQATATFWVPTNSASSRGSPSSSSMAMTSRRFALSSSSDAPWECAPGNPGTYPTSKPVTGSRSTTAVKVFMRPLFHCTGDSQGVHVPRQSNGNSSSWRTVGSQNISVIAKNHPQHRES